MKMNKVVITIVVVMICLVGSALCFVYYNSKLQKTKENNKTIVVNTNDYNLKVLREVNNNYNENYLISPYSIRTALAMVRDGSKGDTYKEIASLIGSENPNNVSNDYVHVANAMFLKNQYKNSINNTYVEQLKNNFNSEVLYDEFETPDVINGWVKKNTNDMIEKILDDMDKDFVLGLANAIAIDVEWQQQFMCQATSSQEFTRKDNTKMNVEMMHHTYEFGAEYIESDRAKGIILPYKEETELEYVAILPNGDLNDYINVLDENEMKKLDESKKKASSDLHLNVSLPRYTYEFDYNYFANGLKNLGVKKMFSKEDADLSGMMTREEMAKQNIANLYVNKAVHKAYIELSETGTKAAAVTYFGISKVTSVGPTNPKMINIVFDKSFLYMIRNKNTKDILFIGVVDKPNEWKGSTCKNEE